MCQEECPGVGEREVEMVGACDQVVREGGLSAKTEPLGLGIGW
jgi:hypothetical protein